MDLDTIEMARPEARTKFLEYRREIHKRHAQELSDAEKRQLTEDEEIMRGYRTLARGHQVINIRETMRRGGVTTRKGSGSFGNTSRYVLPRLAIQWADQTEVFIQGVRPNGSLTFFWNELMNAYATRRNTSLPEGTWDLREIENVSGISTTWIRQPFVAQVPHVPPALRPGHGLGGYMILWEASWHMKSAPRPAKDPALLKPIGGELYAVVAIWELTDLERAVLAGGR